MAGRIGPQAANAALTLLSRQTAHGTVTGPLLDTMQFGYTNNGVSATAKWLVEDIVAPADLVLPTALSATGVPGIGDTYPGIWNVVVSDVSAELAAGSNTTAVVTVKWTTLDFGDDPGPDPEDPTPQPAIDVGSTVQSGTTKFDALGGPLTVSQEYDVYLDDVRDPGNTAVQRFTEWKEVEMQRPMHAVRFTQRRTVSPGIDVDGQAGNATDYVGHVNSDSVFGDQPGMWLCTRLDGTSDDGGETYQVNYEFQRAPVVHPQSAAGEPLFPETGGAEQMLGWGAVISLDGPYQDDSVIQPNPTLEGGGVRAVEIYPKVAFRQLEGLEGMWGS